MNCSIPVSEGKNASDPEICSGHGRCDEEGCHCTAPGRYGDDCSVYFCFEIPYFIDEDVCSGHGSCEDTDKCVCNENYGLEDCSLYIGNTGSSSGYPDQSSVLPAPSVSSFADVSLSELPFQPTTIQSTGLMSEIPTGSEGELTGSIQRSTDIGQTMSQPQLSSVHKSDDPVSSACS